MESAIHRINHYPLWISIRETFHLHFPLDRVYQAVVAQKMDSAIHRINQYPADKYLEN